MVGGSDGQTLNQSLFGGLSSTGASNGPCGCTAPTLMALAKFIAIAAPGHIAEVGTVVADDVDVGATAAHQFSKLAEGIYLISVILLDEYIAHDVWIG